MTALSIQPTFPTFTGADGQPLENGYIWVGTANLNPITNPITVYWDAALSAPATQPIRTLGGYPSNSGTPARLYVNSDYSIQVLDRKGSVVYSAPVATDRYGGGIINANIVVYDPSGTGAVATTVQGKLRESVSVKDFGAVGNGSTDDTSAFSAAIAAVSANGQSIYVPAGTYKLTSAFTTSGHLNMHGDGDKSILDFSSATISTSCITVSGALDHIQNITSASIYGLTVTFASAPSLAVGDIFCISSTDLWNTARAYYYAGEWCQVKDVSGSAATVTNPLYDSYNAANVSVYKMSSRSVSFSDLRIVGGANTFGLVKVQFCDKPIFKNASFRNANYQLIEFDRCYRPEVINCVGFNAGTGTLDDYGIVFGNSQKARVIGGDYYSRRHGVVMGGGDYLCAVTNRDIKVIGATISNDILSGVNSADLHGNTQECSYIDCTIYNGAAWAGMDNGYNNCTITNQSSGSVIYSGEIKGGMLYVRNSKLLTAGDPSANGRGVIDVGGNSSVISSATDRAVSLIVENCYVKAPSLSSGTDFMKVVNDGSVVNVNIYIDGVRADVNAMGSVLRTNVNTGTAYSQAIVVDNISNFPAGTFLHVPQGNHYKDKPHRLMSQSGSLSMTATTGTSLTISSTQSYRYQYPRVPQATVSIGSFTTGFTTAAGQNIGATIFQIREEGIRLALVSTSNANWADTIDKTVNYICQISEV